jgi:hypothetical protein
MTVRRWIYLRALHWKIEFHAWPAGRKLFAVGLPVCALLVYLAHRFKPWQHLPKSGTWEDVLLGTVALAFVPFVMAAYGGHIAAEAIADPKRSARVKTYFWIACVFGIVVAFVQQYRSITQDAAAKDKTSKVEDSVLGQLKSLHDQKPILSPEQVEAKRREDIMTLLRGQYILQHENVSSGIVDGSEPLPADWVNQRLHELNETWAVGETPRASAKPAPQMSFMTLSGNPRFAGRGGEGANFQVGDALTFNVYYKATGPNSIELLSMGRFVAVEPNTEHETQKQFADNFVNEIEKERRTVQPGSSTMMPTDEAFITAFSATDSTKSLVLTQDDLDKLRAGTEFAFVIAQFDYKDSVKTHHLRRCMWLQPPSQAPGTWHFCEVFNTSD